LGAIQYIKSQLSRWITPVQGGGMDGKSWFYMLNRAGAGIPIEEIEKLVLEGYAKNPHVYAVVSAITRPTLSIPWYVYEEKDPKAYARSEAAMKAGRLEEAVFLRHKAVDYYQGSDLDITRLLRKPNELQSFNEFVEHWLSYRLLAGETGIYKFKNSLSNGVRELWNLPMYAMDHESDGTWYGKPKQWILELRDGKIKFNPDDVIHTKMFNPILDPKGLSVRGMSPLVSLATVIPASNKGFTSQLRLVENGGPAGILSNGSNELMLQNQKEDAEKMFNKNYAGEENRGKVYLTTANLKWIQLGLTARDLALLEGRSADLADVCNVYGVPKEIMSDQSGSSFNNKKEAEKKLWNDAILPHLDVLRDVLNAALAPSNTRGRRIFIDYDHHAVPALQQDMEKLSKRVMEALEHHLITPRMANEILGYDNNDSNHNLDRYQLTTQVRYGDEELPGQTGVSNNNDNNDEPAGQN